MYMCLLLVRWSFRQKTNVVYWPSTWPNMPFRKEVTHSNGSYEKKSHRWAWLKKWDKVKIPWYTHRLMHRKRVTCELHDSYFRLMMIKHAFQRLSGQLNYYITRWDRKSVSWRSDELETRCGRESHHPAEGALGTPNWELKISWWEDAGMRTCPREAGPPGLRLSSPGEWERHNADGHKSWGQYVAVLFGLQLTLTVKPGVTLFKPSQ